MRCYVTLSNVLQLMNTKMRIHYSLIRSKAGQYKVCLCFIVLSVIVCTVGYVCSFRRDQSFMDFVSFLSMIIYEVLYPLSWCLWYNCSTWFLDIYKNINLFKLNLQSSISWNTGKFQLGRFSLRQSHTP